MDGYSPSLADISAVTRNNDGFGFGNEGLWLFAILALMGGGFGNWNNRGNGCVTEADLCNANSFSELKGQVGRMNDQQAAIARQSDNAICQLGYQELQNFNALERQLAECCCRNELAIQSVKFDMANYSAATNAAITANAQKILDKMNEDKQAAMAARIQSLELQQALCGVVRYPNAMTYNAGYSPFFGNYGCGCNPCGCTNI